MKTFAANRRARHDYEILEKFEAGLVLKGHEVKSVKSGRASLKGAYTTIHNNEAWLINASIPPYQPKNTPPGYDSTRSRKLLLHKKQIKYLVGKIRAEGLTIIPLKLYTSDSTIKVELALGKGKRKHDKREAKKKREAEREIARAMRMKM